MPNLESYLIFETSDLTFFLLLTKENNRFLQQLNLLFATIKSAFCKFLTNKKRFFCFLFFFSHFEKKRSFLISVILQNVYSGFTGSIWKVQSKFWWTFFLLKNMLKLDFEGINPNCQIERVIQYLKHQTWLFFYYWQKKIIVFGNNWICFLQRLNLLFASF